MRSSRELFDKIENYLEGNLSGRELSDFEKEMSVNSELANEVNLHREMSNLLAEDEPELAFRESLKQIDAETQAKGGFNFRKLFLWSIPILFLLGIWWFSNNGNTLSVTEENLIEESIIKTDLPETDKTIETPTTPELKKIESTKEKVSPKPKNNSSVKEEPKPIERPIAAASFEPNGLLEMMIENNRRSGDIQFFLDKKQGNSKFINKDTPTKFYISGNIQTKERLVEDQFNLYIFSNKKEDYENFQPLYMRSLELEKIDTGYEFELGKSILLAPGLYYYSIEDSETEEQFLVGKFTVK